MNRRAPSPKHFPALRVRLLGVVLAFMSMMGLAGCEVSRLFTESPPLIENAQFMETWKIYLHCQASTRPEEIRADWRHLRQVAQAVTAQSQRVLILPGEIGSWTEALPSRLSVDPRAMAVACAQHGGAVAQAAGQTVSSEWFHASGTIPVESDYVYLLIDAQRGRLLDP